MRYMEKNSLITGQNIFRPESDKIYALNQQDSSEYLLFDFSCEIGKSWFIPPDTANQFGLALNQCDWGKVVTLSDGGDSLLHQQGSIMVDLILAILYILAMMLVLVQAGFLEI